MNRKTFILLFLIFSCSILFSGCGNFGDAANRVDHISIIQMQDVVEESDKDAERD